MECGNWRGAGSGPTMRQESASADRNDVPQLCQGDSEPHVGRKGGISPDNPQCGEEWRRIEGSAIGPFTRRKFPSFRRSNLRGRFDDRPNSSKSHVLSLEV